MLLTILLLKFLHFEWKLVDVDEHLDWQTDWCLSRAKYDVGCRYRFDLNVPGRPIYCPKSDHRTIWCSSLVDTDDTATDLMSDMPTNLMMETSTNLLEMQRVTNQQIWPQSTRYLIRVNLVLKSDSFIVSRAVFEFMYAWHMKARKRTSSASNDWLVGYQQQFWIRYLFCQPVAINCFCQGWIFW